MNNVRLRGTFCGVSSDPDMPSVGLCHLETTTHTDQKILHTIELEPAGLARARKLSAGDIVSVRGHIGPGINELIPVTINAHNIHTHPIYNTLRHLILFLLQSFSPS